MEGTRVATVGIATFTVSLFAAIWVLMCIIGRVTRQAWMYFVGGAMLAIVVIVFVVSPREPAEKVQDPNNVDMKYNTFYYSLGSVTAVIMCAAVAAIACLGMTELSHVRRAKVVQDRDEAGAR